MCNPANVKKHLIGAYDLALLRPMTEVLKNLGSEALGWSTVMTGLMKYQYQIKHLSIN
ncbi:MAG: hypothetical protein CM15mP111_2560 [Hyphomicrobiales bacterium]|nr:MAG: hypothetical protein CM15mP111_2560 [Hyphomicrobiales bacterium]